MNKLPELSDAEFALLGNALASAAEHYTKMATDLRVSIPDIEQAEKDGKLPFITALGAKMLAEQMEQQASDTRSLAARIDMISEDE